MFKFEKCSNTDIERLKKCNELDMDWKYIDNIDTDDSFFETDKVLRNNQIVAIITVSFVEGKAMIDEFEVVRSERGKGIGKEIIDFFLDRIEGDIEILVKDEVVVPFWEKCGFRRKYISESEIPMIYHKQK